MNNVERIEMLAELIATCERDLKSAQRGQRLLEGVMLGQGWVCVTKDGWSMARDLGTKTYRLTPHDGVRWERRDAESMAAEWNHGDVSEITRVVPMHIATLANLRVERALANLTYLRSM